MLLTCYVNPPASETALVIPMSNTSIIIVSPALLGSGIKGLILDFGFCFVNYRCFNRDRARGQNKDDSLSCFISSDSAVQTELVIGLHLNLRTRDSSDTGLIADIRLKSLMPEYQISLI
jgi:hypothetical protein